MPTPENSPQATTLNTTLASKLDPKAKRQQANAAGMRALLAALQQQEATIREGGGAKAIDAQHAKQRLTARERIALLLDPDTDLFELVRSRPLTCTKSGAALPRPASSAASAASPAGSA